MGFGTLFATIAFVVIMATGAFLFSQGILYTAEVVSTSLDLSTELQNARLKTDIDLVSASVSGADLTLSIRNTGSTSILNSDFKYMDVFVRYRKEDTGGVIGIERILYTVSNPPPSGYWTDVSISDDAINPGIFDPDENLNIRIHVSHEINRTDTDKNYAKVVTPNGVWSTKTGFF
jgi:flagellar protein FlaF